MNWKDSAQRSDIDKVNEAFANIRSKIPEIRALSFGEDAGIFPGNANRLISSPSNSQRRCSSLSATAMSPLALRITC